MPTDISANDNPLTNQFILHLHGQWLHHQFQKQFIHYLNDLNYEVNHHTFVNDSLLKNQLNRNLWRWLGSFESLVEKTQWPEVKAANERFVEALTPAYDRLLNGPAQFLIGQTAFRSIDTGMYLDLLYVLDYHLHSQAKPRNPVNPFIDQFDQYSHNLVERWRHQIIDATATPSRNKSHH